MPLITVRNTGYSFISTPAVSILNALLREGLKISHMCGGKAGCGTCRITVVSGMEKLSPVREKEALRLSAVKAGPDQRLACQTYAAGDIIIEIPGLKHNHLFK